jgi:hypothetical protein
MIGLRRRSGKELARYPVELLARLQSPRSTYRQICMLLREDGKMEIPCSFHAWNSGIGITSAADSCPQLYPEYAKIVSKSWIRGFVRQISSHHCPTFKTAIHLSRETRDYIGIKLCAKSNPEAKFPEESFPRVRSDLFTFRRNRDRRHRSISRVSKGARSSFGTRSFKFEKSGDFGIARSASTRRDFHD